MAGSVRSEVVSIFIFTVLLERLKEEALPLDHIQESLCRPIQAWSTRDSSSLTFLFSVRDVTLARSTWFSKQNFLALSQVIAVVRSLAHSQLSTSSSSPIQKARTVSMVPMASLSPSSEMVARKKEHKPKKSVFLQPPPSMMSEENIIGTQVHTEIKAQIVVIWRSRRGYRQTC
ncbi:hypothetical protein EYF80_039922 [Liparis tanakae]|uniref:Uncharacterized protein n=1 Tax=Liparis tanakae TaxID=230148 RepID=A0A4Z2G9J1_9TELE|nr:hypothetical protein EYF80_039922 [Liparis tanakae]